MVGLQAIQDMTAKGVPGGKQGMIEIVRWIMTHAEPLHKPLGGKIGHSGKGDDFREIQPVEAMMQGAAGSFAG